MAFTALMLATGFTVSEGASARLSTYVYCQ
jgi:hypothetical protein